MNTTIKTRLAALAAIHTAVEDEAPLPIPFRVYVTDATGRRIYMEPDADDLAAAARDAPKGIYHANG